VLNVFLADRNLFVHRLLEQPWFDIGTESGRETVWKFLERLLKGIWDTMFVFSAAIFQHFEDQGFIASQTEELKRTGYYSIMQSFYPQIAKLLKKKGR